MKNINVLSPEHRKHAELYIDSKITAFLSAVIFFVLILIVLIFNVTTVLLHMTVESNSIKIEAAKAIGGGDISKQAKLIKTDAENADRFQLGENIGIEYLAAVTSKMDKVRATVISIDNDLSKILISGLVLSNDDLSELVQNLNDTNIFKEVNLIELKRDKSEALQFSLELLVGSDINED